MLAYDDVSNIGACVMKQVEDHNQNCENKISKRDYIKLLCASSALVGFNGLAVASDFLRKKSRTYSFLRPEEVLMAGKKPWDKWKYPGIATKSFRGREGLANILGKSRWSDLMNHGLHGTDFGYRTNANLLQDLKQSPYWIDKTKRLFLFDGAIPNTDNGFLIERAKLLGGFINYARNDEVPLTIRDSYIDANEDARLLYGVTQPTTLKKPGYMTIKNSTIRGYKLAQVNICNGEIIDSHLEFSAADVVIGGWGNNQIPDKSRSLYFQGNLMRLPANKAHVGFNQNAHADIYQVNNQHYTSLVGNILYMPSTNSGYDEGSIGTTSALANGAIMRSNEVFNIGNILVGGAYAIYLGMALKQGAFIKNHFFVNNIIGAGGNLGNANGAYENYDSFGSFNIANNGTIDDRKWANIGFFGNKGSDGYPVLVGGKSMPKKRPKHIVTDSSGRWKNPEGIFNYDKGELTPRTIELLLAIGDGMGISIINEDTLELNPYFDLGELTA